MHKSAKRMIVIALLCVMILSTAMLTVGNKSRLTVEAATERFVPLWPVNVYRINVLDRYSWGDAHNGIDVAASSGTTVNSVANGTVVSVYNSCSHVGSGDTRCSCNGGYGNYIEIKHIVGGKTYYSRYGHLLQNSIVVSSGATVTAGQKIAKSGSSGNSSGAHLHFEVFEGSRTSDKARKTFQFYKDNADLIDGATFSSHIPSSSEFFGWWVKQNCTYTGGVYKFTHWKHSCVDMGSSFTATLLHPASGYGVANINGNVELGVTGTTATRWNFTKNSDGSYVITSVADGKALEVNWNDIVDGANIGPYEVNGSPAQKWFIMQNGTYYSLVSAASGKALDVADGGTALGNNIHLWTRNETAAQIIDIVTGYAVSYDANGGSGAPASQTCQPGESVTIPSTVPTMLGKNFYYWNRNGMAYYPGETFVPSGDCTLTAVWESSTAQAFQTYNTTINFANQTRVYHFTPTVSATYRFESYGSNDTQVNIYNTSGTQLAYDDDDGEGYNFLLDYTMEANTTYYIEVRRYSTGTGSIKFDISAVGTCGDNLTWELDPSGTLTISGTGAMDEFYFAPWYDFESFIKYIEIGGGVNSIGDCAFRVCSSLRSVTIPDSVTSIGWAAFSGCSSLTSVIIPSSVTTIGGDAFRGCSSVQSMTIPFVGGSRKTASDTYQYPFGYIFGTYSYTGGVATTQYYYGSSTSSTTYETYYIPSSLKSVTVTGGNLLYGAFRNCSMLTSVTIPDSVTTIGTSAFRGCNSLTSVTIGDSVTTIDDSAFAYCDSLTSVTIPDSVTSIGYCAFYGCDSLTSVTIGNSVTTIGDSVFSGCSSLTSVTIPDSVTTIGNSAFYSCDSLTSVTIPDSVTTIGDGAFSNCGSLKYNTYSDGKYLGNSTNPYMVLMGTTSTTMTSFEIHNATKIIGYNVFSYCSDLTSVTIPDSVTTISDGAFNQCSSLASVTIGNNVTTIGNYAFQNCISLTTVIIPDSTTSIGLYAFYNCSSLTSVTFPVCITTIGNGAFFSCSRLEKVYYQGTAAQWGAVSIGANNEPLTNATLHIHTHSYTAGTQITEQPTCTAAGRRLLFCECGATVSEIVLAKGHSYTYKATKNPTTSATGTLTGTCSACSGTTTVSLPKLNTTDYSYQVTKAATCTATGTGKYTWKTTTYGNFSIAVTIAATGHTEVIDAAVAATCTTAGKTEGKHCSVCNAVIVAQTIVAAKGHTEVIDKAVAATCTTAGKKEGSHCSTCNKILVMQEEIPAVGHFFENGICAICGENNCIASGTCGAQGDNLRWMLDEDGTLTISGTGAMQNYSSTSMPWRSYLLSIKNIILSDGIATIGSSAFSSCRNLITVTIPDTVYDIGWYAFSGCSKLQTITIPAKVKSIGSQTFLGCSALTSVYLHENIYTIGGEAFLGSGVTSIYISKNVTSIGTGAFQQCQNLTGIWVSEDNTQYASDANGVLFNKSKTNLIQAPGSLTGKYTIPNTVMSINQYAFSYCEKLSTIEILANVSTLENYTFQNCSNLTAVVLPDSLQKIGNRCFSKCSSLRTITIPDSVTAMDYYAFEECSSLENVCVGEGVTTLSRGVFYNCVNLQSVTIPSNVTKIIDLAFCGCNELTDVYYQGTPDQWNAISIGSDNSALTNAVRHYHSHNFTTDSIIESTCTNTGSVVMICQCGKTQTEAIPAKGHTEVIDAAVAATCTTSGKTEGKHCSVCNTVIVAQTTVAAKGHTEVIDKAVAATCTTTGKTEGKHCSVCNTVIVAQTTVAAKGHTEVIDKAVAATCTTSGKTEGKHCSVCNTVIVAQTTVAAKGHTEVIDKAVAATCTTSGKTEGKHCSVCGTVLVAQQTIPASNHNYAITPEVKPTCTEPGMTSGVQCTDCGTYLLSGNEIPALGHTVVIDPAVDATCNTPGKTEGSHCSVCNEILVAQQELPVTSHSYAIMPEVKPTCTKPGYSSSVQCSLCKEYLLPATEVPALGHTEVIDPAVDAACTAAGLTEGKHCSVCNEVLIPQEKIPAVGHNFENGICTGCGEKDAAAIRITQQPAAQTAEYGSNAVFTVVAEGENLTYRWQYSKDGGMTWNNATTSMTGYNTKKLTLAATAARNGYMIRCKLTDSNGNTLFSDAVLFTCTEPNFSFTKHPADETVKLGNRAAFTVKVDGNVKAYQWQYQMVENGPWWNCTAYTMGYNTTELNVIAAEKRQGFLYRCRATDSSGNKYYSNPAELTVDIPASYAVLSQPKNTWVMPGKTTTFHIDTQGEGLKFQWEYHKGVDKTGPEYYWIAMGSTTGCKTDTLTIAGISGSTNRDGWAYRCVVTDPNGYVYTTDHAFLYVTTAQITSQPKSVTAAAGDKAVFQVNVTGEVTSYQWQYSKDGGKSWYNSSSATQGYNTGILTVGATAARNGFMYRCVIIDREGNRIETNPVTLTVK